MPIAPLKDGIDNVVVTYDRDPAIFNVGETITGTVTVFCEETTPVRGIRVKGK